jgi:mono/diheme cytochrome c family protein
MMAIRRIFAVPVLLVLASTLLWAGTRWMDKVPAREHERTNPMAGNPDARLAGQLLFADHCAKCHGDDAEGKGKHPSLLSGRVQNEATPGDIHWLLVNGSLKRGMPSWSKLPDPQLWQLISYIKSLSR